jgi:hypothetical protein
MCLCCKVQFYVVESCSDGQTSIADKEDKVNDLVSKKTADLFDSSFALVLDTCYEIDRVFVPYKEEGKWRDQIQNRHAKTSPVQRSKRISIDTWNILQISDKNEDQV